MSTSHSFVLYEKQAQGNIVFFIKTHQQSFAWVKLQRSHQILTINLSSIEKFNGGIKTIPEATRNHARQGIRMAANKKTA